MTVRAYLPTTLAVLAEQHAKGELVVTADVVVCAEDDEESEYDALMTAAESSAALLTGPGRRVVVVAELEKEPEPGWTIPLKRVVAVHADTEDGADPDADLAWFATQEIEDVVLDMR